MKLVVCPHKGCCASYNVRCGQCSLNKAVPDHFIPKDYFEPLVLPFRPHHGIYCSCGCSQDAKLIIRGKLTAEGKGGSSDGDGSQCD